MFNTMHLTNADRLMGAWLIQLPDVFAAHQATAIGHGRVCRDVDGTPAPSAAGVATAGP